MSDTLNSICINILNNKKLKKLDIYTVYRAITHKKNRISIPLEIFDLESLVSHEELFDFIKIINPYFDGNNQKKLDEYRAYYLISKKIVEECELLLKEQNRPSYYKIYDNFSKKYLTFSNLNIESASEPRYEAQFYNHEEADKILAKYMRLYNFLKIERDLQILTFNSQHKIIDSDCFR